MRLIRSIQFTIMVAWIPFMLNGQATLPEGFIRILVAESLNPTDMAQVPDGRIFIAEKDGKVRIVRDGILLPDPFLTVDVDKNNERGVSGIAVDPKFELNNYFYIFYTVPGTNTNRLSRFTANGDLAVPGSEKILLETDPLRSSIHNGGAIQFDAEGKLLFSTGEGGDSHQAVDLRSLLGKILRINNDGSIPEDNPYYTQLTGNYRAIWATGFRNAYTMSTHPETFELFANDVGGGEFEEINRVVAGGFYGWDNLEGYSTGQELPGNYEDPVYAYPHSEGCAIVGSTIYLPEEKVFPEQYHGKYFFADYCAGWVKVMDLESYGIQETFMTGADRIVAMLTSADGSMYYLERKGIGDGSPQDNTATVNGVLWKVVYTGDGSPFISRQPRSTTAVIGESAEFEVDVSGADPLEFTWFVNGEARQAGQESAFEMSDVALADDGAEIWCRIANGAGEVVSDKAVLSVTSNQRPVVSFISPEMSWQYKAGDVLQVEATVTDPEDGTVAAEDISWWIDFHHRDHIHPAVGRQAGPVSGTYEIPVTGEIDPEVWYRVNVIAYDSEGLERRSFIDIWPVLTHFRVETEPPGLRINADGKQLTAPFEIESVAGLEHILIAPLNQVVDESVYLLDGWEGSPGSSILTFQPGENMETHRAIYTEHVLGNGVGLDASYYPNMEFSGSPALTRIDTVIDFNFYFDPPVEGIDADMFSIRWEGFITPYKSGNHNLIAIVNDGVRVWIDDKLILERWELSGTTNLAGGSVYLDANKLHKIKVEFFEYNWGASISLRWSSDDLEEEVIPRSQLFPKNAFPFSDFADIVIKPNPVSDGVLRMEINSRAGGKLPAKVYDSQGREVVATVLDLGIGSNEVELDIPSAIPGVYYFQLGSDAYDPIVKSFVVH